MGEISKPIMTAVGVLYRNFHDSEVNALKSAVWATTLFGGKATSFDLIGPGKKGYYEAAILATVPANVQNVKPRKDAPTDWFQTPTQAYVFFDKYEQPAALFFYKYDLWVKPTTTPPMMGYQAMSLEEQ